MKSIETINTELATIAASISEHLASMTDEDAATAGIYIMMDDNGDLYWSDDRMDTVIIDDSCVEDSRELGNIDCLLVLVNYDVINGNID